ncbi:unnamed protein product [Lymnaea stagnalis]|uniref:Voltage-gated hydrogen channel 1 n=1 Tax=Lymnaea stagnalis TaxID=6523 RepID=A0AAV2IC95_LYMST
MAQTRAGQEVKENLLEMGGNNGVHKERDAMRLERKKMESVMLNDDRTPEDGPDESFDDVMDGNNSDGSSSETESHHSHQLDPNSCKGKLAAFLKTNVVQYSVIALVIADCVIIVLELLIDMEIIVFPENPPEPHPSANHTSHPVVHVSHGEGESDGHGGGHLNASLDSYNSTGNETDAHHPHYHSNKEKAEHVLHALSLAILSIFMVEVSLKIFMEGTHLLKQPAEVFDAVVVIVSFTLDITFSFVSVTSMAQDAAGLMVLLRLWRVTRIINGVILSVKLDAKKKLDVMKRALRISESENKKLRSKLDKLERENNHLKNKRFPNEISLDTPVQQQNDTQPHYLFENNLHEIELRDLSDKT